MEQLNNFKKMIAKGQTARVFDQLITYMDSESFRNNKANQSYYNTIVLLSSRLEAIVKESNLGIITNDQEQAARTRVNYDLMNLMDEFPNSSAITPKSKAYRPIIDRNLPDEEEQFWKNARKKNNIFFYESYRQLYPDGKYIKIANKRVKEIKTREQIKQNKLDSAKEVAAANATDTKIGGLAIFLACAGGIVTFIATNDVKMTLWALIGVYVLMVIITALFARTE